eukprot:4015866-Amphidinium_carterae.1
MIEICGPIHRVKQKLAPVSSLSPMQQAVNKSLRARVGGAQPRGKPKTVSNPDLNFERSIPGGRMYNYLYIVDNFTCSTPFLKNRVTIVPNALLSVRLVDATNVLRHYRLGPNVYVTEIGDKHVDADGEATCCKL